MRLGWLLVKRGQKQEKPRKRRLSGLPVEFNKQPKLSQKQNNSMDRTVRHKVLTLFTRIFFHVYKELTQYGMYFMFFIFLFLKREHYISTSCSYLSQASLTAKQNTIF